MRSLLLLLSLASSLAQGADFSQLQPEKSTINFVSRQMNVPVEGVFKKFTAQISLDPARPEAGRARIEIDLASIDAGSAEANDEIKGKNWFNVGEFPKAIYTSFTLKALGGGRYETSGKMTLKGKTLDIRAPFTIKQEKGVLTLDGSFPLKRLEYGIGSGIWSDTSVVADEVQVKFHFIIK